MPRNWEYTKTEHVRVGMKDQYPLRPDEHTLRICYDEQDNPVHVKFLCPCGCKDLYVLAIRQGKDHHPSWNYFLHTEGRTSLSPSVDSRVGCKSHFTITQGKVLWHASNG